MDDFRANSSAILWLPMSRGNQMFSEQAHEDLICLDEHDKVTTQRMLADVVARTLTP